MKRVLLAAAAALTLCSGCIFDDEFWDDYDSTYDSPSGDDSDCDCDEFSAAPSNVMAHHMPSLAPTEMAR